MINLTVLVSSKCNLRCKFCATYTPYQKHGRNYSVPVIIKSVDRFFDAIPEGVELFTLNGGEPLLHPDLPEMIENFSRYKNRCTKFEIITNGTIIPNERLINALNLFGDKADVMIDDYGPNISGKALDAVEKLNQAGICKRLRKYYGQDAHFGGWVDVSDFEAKNRTMEQISKLYRSCNYTTVYKDHFFIFEDTAHICYVNHKLLDFVTDNPTEYVNLHSDVSANEIRRQLIGLRERDHLTACINCNGFLTEAQRIHPAEQLSN